MYLIGSLWILYSVVETTCQRIIDTEPCDVPGRGRLRSLEVSPCSASPCQLSKGRNITLNFDYIFDQDSENVTISATIDVLGIQVPVPNLEPDLCLEALECPVRRNREYGGIISMPVSNMPVVSSIGELDNFRRKAS
ncbi:NPC intracellular cholesterol transporter 2 [Galendromus occidentalis]|uniref:NPC intracellular cholesterol transporter 2 n=1 Tax=Galendromus occidentalis TaxID=34638 RepID=A0AAJ6QVB1_9ACAR|nr:NPC intracellular cholesterol transporter 2 [Galendromus occidentalis]